MGVAEIVVVDSADRHRYEISVDGTVAGVTEYRDRGNRRSLLHTEIDPDHEGHGLGSQLVRFVLDDARARGLEVLPFCPFVRGYIANHRDAYVDLVPVAERGRFGLG